MYKLQLTNAINAIKDGFPEVVNVNATPCQVRDFLISEGYNVKPTVTTTEHKRWLCTHKSFPTLFVDVWLGVPPRRGIVVGAIKGGN